MEIEYELSDFSVSIARQQFFYIILDGLHRVLVPHYFAHQIYDQLLS